MCWRASPVGIPWRETQAGALRGAGCRIPPAELGHRASGSFFDDDSPAVWRDVADLDAALSRHGDDPVRASGTIGGSDESGVAAARRRRMAVVAASRSADLTGSSASGSVAGGRAAKCQRLSLPAASWHRATSGSAAASGAPPYVTMGVISIGSTLVRNSVAPEPPPIAVGRGAAILLWRRASVVRRASSRSVGLLAGRGAAGPTTLSLTASSVRSTVAVAEGAGDQCCTVGMVAGEAVAISDSCRVTPSPARPAGHAWRSGDLNVELVSGEPMASSTRRRIPLTSRAADGERQSAG